MSWLRIAHETIYRYRMPVEFGPHRLVLRPREGHDVHVEKLTLHLAPQAEVEWSRDLFGNSIATVHFLEAAEEMLIRSEVLLHQTAPFPARKTRPAEPVKLPLQFSEMESFMAAAYLQSTYPEDRIAVKSWTEEAIGSAKVERAEDLVALVAREIRARIKYARRVERGVQSPTETLQLQSGSCRDMATLMLEVLRTLGFPARFATGYLDCAASHAGEASTHAWAEAYLPEIGWVGYDPMLGSETSAKHIVTGVSSHPRGVMPVTGSYLGKKKAFLEMKVSVHTERVKVASGLESAEA